MLKKKKTHKQTDHFDFLGEHAVMDEENGEPILRMERGEKRNCPGGSRRTSIVSSGINKCKVVIGSF